MFVCERCGCGFTAGVVAVTGMPLPKICRRCEADLIDELRRERNRFFEFVATIVLLLAAAVCLWGQWRATDPRGRDLNPPHEPEQVLPGPGEPPDPQPGDDGAAPRRLTPMLAAIMSLDF